MINDRFDDALAYELKTAMQELVDRLSPDETVSKLCVAPIELSEFMPDKP